MIILKQSNGINESTHIGEGKMISNEVTVTSNNIMHQVPCDTNFKEKSGDRYSKLFKYCSKYCLCSQSLIWLISLCQGVCVVPQKQIKNT